MDTVWIKLTNTSSSHIEENEYFMFGPTGVIKFRKDKNVTLLFNSAKTLLGEVKETPEDIMIILAKIRGTTNKLNGKTQKRRLK